MTSEREEILQRLWWKAAIGFDDMREAAEFEAKVAAQLALGCESQLPCNGCWRANWKTCNLRKGYWDCADCFLKTARLIVEEKINGKV